jgi:hypothetical protein
MDNIEELLKAIRGNTDSKSWIPVLEQAKHLRDGHRKPPERRRKRRKQDRRTTRKKYNAWRREHADEIREYNSGLRQMFFHLRREVNRRNKKRAEQGGSPAIDSEVTSWHWELSLAEWITMWLSCPAVEIGHNVYKPAWKCRGRDSSKDVQLKRVDVTKPWNINNLEIWHKGRRIYPGT